jgi:hypothetical protein
VTEPVQVRRSWYCAGSFAARVYARSPPTTTSARATAHDYLREGIDVLASQPPELGGARSRQPGGRGCHLNPDGTVIRAEDSSLSLVTCLAELAERLRETLL